MIPGVSYNQLLSDCLRLRQQLQNWVRMDPATFELKDLFNLVMSSHKLLDQTKIYDEVKQ